MPKVKRYKSIFAIGGSTIKTAYDEIKVIAKDGKIDVLMHNGASIFHDFQRATEHLGSHSHSLDKLLEDYHPNRAASELVWKWIGDSIAPPDSLTDIVQRQEKPVLMFTILGADFWQLFRF